MSTEHEQLVKDAQRWRSLMASRLIMVTGHHGLGTEHAFLELRLWRSAMSDETRANQFNAAFLESFVDSPLGPQVTNEVRTITCTVCKKNFTYETTKTAGVLTMCIPCVKAALDKHAGETAGKAD